MFMLVSAAYANDYWYVSLMGDDSNDCLHVSTSCASINGVLNKPAFQSGDTIQVAEGDFDLYVEGGVRLTKDVHLSGAWDETFTTQGRRSAIGSGVDIAPGTIVTIDHFGLYIDFDNPANSPLFNQGTVTLTNSFVSSLRTPGIINFGNLSMQGSTAVGNRFDGVINHGVMTITNSTVTENRLSGIFNSGTLTMTRTLVSEQIEGRGTCAGVVNQGGTITIIDSAIVRNVTNYAGEGGGLCNFGTDARATVVNSSIVDNEANYDYEGGGIFNEDGQVTLYNTTVSGNDARTGGGIYNEGGIVTLHNSLVAGNTSREGGADCDGALVSEGYNLVGDTTGCAVTAAEGDQFDVAAGLGPRERRWAYQPLVPGSRAINAGDPQGCRGPDGQVLAADQRGVTRVGRCDIGAFEYDAANDPLTHDWLPLVQSIRP
jgi:hypothetical protein